MTLDEFGGGVAALQAGIGRDFSDAQKAVWWDCTKDLDGRAFQLACKRWLCEVASGFPAIAEIRRMALEAVNGQQETAAEAWERVTAAIRRFGYTSPGKAREACGEMVWMAIGGNSGWQRLCDSENLSVERGQFRMAFEQLTERQTKRAALPADVRPKLANDVRRIVERTTNLIGGVE